MLAPAARLAELAQQRVGTTLRRGKYTLEALLGMGSMAAVYRAAHRNGTEVAIKVLHTAFVGDDAIHSRFLREGYIANQVSHPGVVRVLDDDVDDDGTTYLVLELLHGSTIEDVRESSGGTLTPLRVLDVVRELLGILAAVHAAGIVHRDIKPENIFLTDDGIVKLLDLGIARMGPSRLTVEGQMLGSPSYMSPEQASGRLDEVDARSDIYGVGAIMFTLLTGQLVHNEPDPVARLRATALSPARSLFSAWPDAKGALANLVDVALRFDRTQRWNSADAMARALDGVLELIRPSVRPPSPVEVFPGKAATVLGFPAPWSPAADRSEKQK